MDQRDGGDDDACLPTHLMGEKGRDHLFSLFGEAPLAKKIVEAIKEDGYIVLPGVFTSQEMDVELDRAWDFVQKVSPTVQRNKWDTWWPMTACADPWPHAQRDMFQLHQAGWVFTELREKFVQRVFEPLYGTKELHVSKDGFTFQRPTSGELGRTPNDHFDQGNRWMGLQCIQGSVALTDQSENDGCFKVWPGSHKHREEILSHPKHRKAGRGDFTIIHDDDKEILRERGIEGRRIPVKRGDVVLWRSDVCHCGAPPLGQCDTYRVVAYVCSMPAALTPEAVYAQKRRAYEGFETGCHYPSREEWFEMGDRHKKFAWKPYFTSPPKLTLRQQELYGLVRYGASEGQAGACAAASSGSSSGAQRGEEQQKEQHKDPQKEMPSDAGDSRTSEVESGSAHVSDAAAFPPLSAACSAEKPGKPKRWGRNGA